MVSKYFNNGCQILLTSSNVILMKNWNKPVNARVNDANSKKIDKQLHKKLVTTKEQSK